MNTENSRSGALATLIPYAKPHRARVALAFLLVVAVVVIDLVQPWLVKEVIDRFTTAASPDSGAVLLISAAYFALVLLSFGLTWRQELLFQETGILIVRSLRIDLFRHIQRLSLRYFDQNSPGRIITNVSSDTETLNTFFTQFLATSLRGVVSLVLIMVFMMRLDRVIAMYCFLLLPAVMLSATFFQRRMQVANAEARHRLGVLIGYLAENLGGMRIVQIFHQEAKQQRRLDEKNRAYFDASVEENRRFLIFFNVTEMLADLTVAGLVWFGGRGVIHGAITFGVLYAFVGYIRRFFQPVSMILLQMNTLQSAIVASSRIGRTLAEKPDIVESEGVEAPPVAGSIRFEGVGFAYRAGHPVLHDINLSIRPGERVGFVGATGAGKSSIMNLVTRFYDVTSGSVLIDGKDIREWPLDELRRAVGIVQQEVTLFSGTVIDNVRFFRSDISEERVREACRITGAEALILRLPEGYQTMLSERASTLSAGERQLFSFARVLLFNPRILILDEATSNLDSRTEEVLQEAIHRVSAGRTLLVIAHRLSTVQEMDTICVLDHGRIVEKGTHIELLEREGHYHRLHHAWKTLDFVT
jgi:ATP-binding cassette subfamily B protein